MTTVSNGQAGLYSFLRSCYPCAMTKRLLNITDLSAYLGITRPTCYKVTRMPGFPRPVVVADRKVWNVEDIDAWRLQQPPKSAASPVPTVAQP
jgi:predicted DNA-binding transcriptional regulator AlpA